MEYTNLLTGGHIVDLSRPVAASRNVLAIMAKAHTADNTLVLKGVHQLDIEHAGNGLVKDDPPVIPNLLYVVRKTIGVKLAQVVASRRRRRRRRAVLLRRVLLNQSPAVVRSRVSVDLRGLAGAIVRDRGVDLRGRRAGRGATDGTLVARARRRGALRGLGGEAARLRSRRILALELRLLRRRRRRGRRALHARGSRRHVRGLLLLLLRVRRRGKAALANLARENGANDAVVARITNLRRRGLRGTDVLRGVHGARRTATALQLATQHGDLLLVPGERGTLVSNLGLEQDKKK